MGDARDIVELGSGSAVGGAAGGERFVRETERVGAGRTPQPFLRLWFRCSGQYARATKSADGTVYMGRCPKCARTARFPVGPGGTSERFFEVSCSG